MRYLAYILPLMLLFATACGGGGEEQQETESETTQQQESQTESSSQYFDEPEDDIRTIDIVGIDQMKFVVEDEDQEGITVGSPTGSAGMALLESISVEPGEEIRIRLHTDSDLPASSMAHNLVLLAMTADVDGFADEAANAADNDYIPQDEELQEQIIAETELAAGGETVEVVFEAPEEEGDYEFICTFPGHYAANMKGILTVE